MQDATCSLKAPNLIHHGWGLQGSSPDLDHRTEDALVPSPLPEASLSDQQTDRQSGDQSFGAVVSSLNRLSLSTTETSPSPLPHGTSLMTSAVTSGYSNWPTDNDLFQSAGLPSAIPNLASNFPGSSPFSTSATQLQPSVPRRAITGHPSMPTPAADGFGVPPGPTNGNRTYTSWTNPAQTLNWLQAGRPGPLPTRFGPVHHGRSMSVQNINMTGSSSMSSVPPRKSPNQYVSRGGTGNTGIFGGLPSLPGYNGQGSRAPFVPHADQFGSRYPDIDEKSLLAGLSQDISSSAGLEAQWLDLIRSAVQDQVRGLSGANCGGWPFNQQQFDHSRQAAVKNKLPFGMLESCGGDVSSLEKQLALAGCGFTGSAGLAAAMSGSVERPEVYSRKVFVGGLPPDIDEEEIMAAFRRFGPLVVDWPHKAESKSYFPPKGYCFLLFQEELSVQALVEACTVDDSKLYWCVSSPTMKDKPVQVRPWNLSDADFVMDGSQTLDPRKTVFVGGVPRPLRAVELAMIMGRLYGGVCYAGIDTDPELKYPKGAGRVAFSSQQSYIAAISARFVQLQHGDIDKRVEVKPYVLDDQICDECAGVHSGGKFAPFFCANVTCLQYYCEPCWARIHSAPGREFHKPLVKEGADRPRAMPFRWC